MNSERIKEIQQETAYPDSVSVRRALLQVWNECEQQNKNLYSDGIINLELLIKSQEELKERSVLTNDGISYLNGLKTALKQFKKQ